MASESLLKIIELLSVQQANSREINGSTENFITVQETGKNKKTKMNRTPQNSTELHLGIHLKFFSLKKARTNWNLLMRKVQCYLHLIMHLAKEHRKSS